MAMFSLNAPSAERHNSDPGASSWRIQAVSPNRAILEQLTPLLHKSLPGASISELRSYPDLREIAHAFGSKAPDVCFLDVATDVDRAVALIPELMKLYEGMSIIALLGTNDSQLILRCMRQGAAEFLIQPFSADQLEVALGKLARTMLKDKPEPKELAKIFCVMPAKGACGATTMACNIAYQWKRLGASRVLLADMDALTGTMSFLLKIKSSYSFLDVLNRAETLDTDLWKAMVTHQGGVDILLAPELLLEGLSELHDAVPVLDYARKHYDVVVLDAASVYGDWNLSQAKLCDELLLVTTNELPALQAAQRALSYLDTHRIGRWKIKVLVNRYDKDVGLTKEVIGTALHTDVFHVVPSDYESVQKSLLDGKPLPTNSAIGRNVAILGERLAGKEKEPPKKSSTIGSILSLFGRTSS